MYDQFQKLEEELKQAKSQLSMFKSKNKELTEESELLKTEVDKLKNSEQFLRKQLRQTSFVKDKIEEENKILLKTKDSEWTEGIWSLCQINNEIRGYQKHGRRKQIASQRV
jgi:hypothetical protein